MANRYAGRNEPEDVLDFHDLGRITNTEVKRETRAFIQDAKRRGLARVRIVSGKGRHSAGKPIVKPQVERTLRELEREGVIRSYGPEKLTAGGDGAFFVRL